MVETGLSKTPESAKVMLFRDAKADILSQFCKGCPIYELKEIAEKRERRKVVMHAYVDGEAKPVQRHLHPSIQNAPGHSKKLIPKDVFDKVRISKERSVAAAHRACVHADKVAAERPLEFIPADSLINRCKCGNCYSCSYVKNMQVCRCTPTSNCDSCRSFTAPVSAAALVPPPPRWLQYGLLGQKWRYDFDDNVPRFDALDLLQDSLPFLQHRLFFEFTDEVNAYSREFATIMKRNKRIDGDIYVDGVEVHYTRYERGLVLVQSFRSKSPLQEHEISAFMQKIKDRLPWNIAAPDIERWKIVATDAHFDLPTEDRNPLNTEFDFKGYRIRAYNKMINRRRILRVEAAFNPSTHVTTTYHEALQRARLVLLEIAGCSRKP
jgi:hypothetical protein